MLHIWSSIHKKIEEGGVQHATNEKKDYAVGTLDTKNT
jgi:hypothetical protein